MTDDNKGNELQAKESVGFLGRLFERSRHDGPGSDAHSRSDTKTTLDLADIQGKYIPKLVCYGYYGGEMGFVIGMTIAGTT